MDDLIVASDDLTRGDYMCVLMCVFFCVVLFSSNCTLTFSLQTNKRAASFAASWDKRNRRADLDSWVDAYIRRRREVVVEGESREREKNENDYPVCTCLERERLSITFSTYAWPSRRPWPSYWEASVHYSLMFTMQKHFW